MPANVHLGTNALITGPQAFKRFFSLLDPGLTVGDHCTLDGVHFAAGKEGRIQIGHHCYLTNVVLLCDLELRIGNYVVIGWNTSIADTDFHPLEPARRIADAIACSPLGKGQPRPEVACLQVVIEDGVWIGPNAAILKGVSIGAGSFIEPGSVVTRNVPPGSRIAGNPAQAIGQV